MARKQSDINSKRLHCPITTVTNQSEPYLQETTTGDDVSSSSFEVKEANILQERKIGLWGAISLIVNKIIGAGWVILQYGY